MLICLIVVYKSDNKLLSSNQRAWGKTTVLNEIGFIYQALGYNVILVTQFSNSNEHYANLLFDYVFTKATFIADYNKTIVIVDEYDYNNRNFQEIIRFFNQLKIPYVGFVKFEDTRYFEVEEEYKYHRWLQDNI